MELHEYIKKEGSKWVVYSDSGKNMGTYSTKAEAEKRLKQIEMFKNMKESDIMENLKEQAGQGQGVGNPKQNDGGVSFCVCPSCGKEIEHDRGVPCLSVSCPECGAKMIGKVKESDMEKFYRYMLTKFGVKISEEVDTEAGIEKVLRALLVDQYGMSKPDAGKLVKAGFNKEKVMEVMQEIGLADKLKADYLKLVNLWKTDVDAQAHSDLVFLMKESENHIELLESKDKEGSIWEVVVIEKGKSYNNTVYGDEALEDIKKIINESDKEGSPIKCNAFKMENVLNHLPNTARKFVKGFAENIVGWFKNARVKGKQLIAELHLDEGAKKIMSLLKTAHKKGIKKPFGLSIDGDGNVIDALVGGKQVLEVAGVNSLNSIDCVTYPSAGGKFLSIIESICKEKEMFKKILERLGKIHPSLIEGVDLEKVDLETVKRIIKEASEKDARFSLELTEENAGEVLDAVIDIQIAEASKKDEPKTEPKTEPAKIEPKAEPKTGDAVTEAQKALEAVKALQEETKKEKCKLVLSRLLDESNLPQAFKDTIRDEFSSRIFEESELQNRISIMEKTVSEFKEQNGTPARVQVQVTERDKKVEELQEDMDALFGIEDENGKVKQGRFRGIYEAYVAITGDSDVNLTELNPNARRSSLHEAIVTSDFTEILKNSATKVLVREYNIGEAMYRKIANVVPIKDFKTQDRPSMGEFANLATVVEDDEYQEFTNPSEENAQYAPLTKGNIIGISRRAILNDDLGAFKKLTKMMGKSALRTVNQFAFNALLNFDTAINDGTIYDGTALYTVAHANTGTDPLSYTSLDNALTAMWLHKDMDDRLEYGIEPKYLVVPRQLKSTAVRILKSDKLPDTSEAQSDVNPVYDACEILVSPFLQGDADNWYLVADPQVWDGLELGFVLGKETPTLITANNEATGTMFTRDRIQYKIRHEYGIGTLDYRPFYGALVP